MEKDFEKFFDNKKIFNILLFCFLILSFAAIAWNSVTYDEPVYLYIGLNYWQNGLSSAGSGFHDPQNPQFIPMLMTLPAFLLKTNLSNSLAEKNILSGRMMILFLACILLIAFYLFLKNAVNSGAALIGLFLLSFSPEILAHSSLATIDIGFSLFFFCTLSFFYLGMNGSKKFFALSAISMLLAFISKLYAFSLIPLIAVLIIADFFFEKKIERLIKNFAVFIAIGIFLLVAINLFYGFRGIFSEKIFNMPMPLPGDYVQRVNFGLSRQSAEVDFSSANWKEQFGKRGAGMSYFFGKRYFSANPLYYLGAMAIKFPIPIILLFFAGVFFSALERKKILISFLLIALLFVLFISFFNSIQIGLRYALPIYPAIILIASYGALKIFESKKLKPLFFALSVWLVLSVLLIAPNFLAYFNELIGGPMNGYLYLSDSNLDWGQEYHLARQFLESHPGVNEKPPCSKTSGKFLTYANRLNGILSNPPDCYDWLKKEIPKERIGYTFFYYEIG